MALLILMCIAQVLTTLLRTIQIAIVDEIQMAILYCAAFVTLMIVLAAFHLWGVIALVAIVQFAVFGYKAHMASKYGYKEPERYVY